jgi:hypothetical protein
MNLSKKRLILSCIAFVLIGVLAGYVAGTFIFSEAKNNNTENPGNTENQTNLTQEISESKNNSKHAEQEKTKKDYSFSTKEGIEDAMLNFFKCLENVEPESEPLPGYNELILNSNQVKKCRKELDDLIQETYYQPFNAIYKSNTTSQVALLYPQVDSLLKEAYSCVYDRINFNCELIESDNYKNIRYGCIDRCWEDVKNIYGPDFKKN